MIIERCPDAEKHAPHGRCPGRKRDRERSRSCRRTWYGRTHFRLRNGQWACAEPVAGGARCRGRVTAGSCPVHPALLDLPAMRTMTIGQRVKYLREWRGMTTQTLADVLGVSASSVQKIEQGVRPGDSLTFLCKVSDIFRISLEDLISGYREVYGR